MTPSFKMINGCEVLEEIINGHMWSEKGGSDMNVILKIKELSLILTRNEFCLLNFENLKVYQPFSKGAELYRNTLYLLQNFTVHLFLCPLSSSWFKNFVNDKFLTFS